MISVGCGIYLSVAGGVRYQHTGSLQTALQNVWYVISCQNITVTWCDITPCCSYVSQKCVFNVTKQNYQTHQWGIDTSQILNTPAFPVIRCTKTYRLGLLGGRSTQSSRFLITLTWLMNAHNKVATVALPVKTTVHMAPSLFSISKKILPEKSHTAFSNLILYVCKTARHFVCLYQRYIWIMARPNIMTDFKKKKSKFRGWFDK